ncbi:hypothetical protein GF351_05060 [Candidatus Woesearchaeota archaeon]|nr:hypothetical protein [Candidatus Woesearchaeota archaeon]
MTRNITIRGSVPPLLTMLNEDMSMDEDAQRELLWHVCTRNKPYAVFVNGTTGEFRSLRVGTQLRNLEVCIQEVRRINQMQGSKIYVFTGIGVPAADEGEAIEFTVKQAQAYRDMGADGLVIPFAHFVSHEGIPDAMSALNSLDIALIGYDNPAFGYKVSDSMAWDFSFYENARAFKDSSGTMDIAITLSDRYPDVTVLTGDEGKIAEAARNGSVGHVASMANLVTKLNDIDYREDLQKSQKEVNELKSICHPYGDPGGAIYIYKWALGKIYGIGQLRDDHPVISDPQLQPADKGKADGLDVTLSQHKAFMLELIQPYI